MADNSFHIDCNESSGFPKDNINSTKPLASYYAYPPEYYQHIVYSNHTPYTSEQLLSNSNRKDFRMN